MITKKKPAKLAEEILLELYPFRRQLNNNACQHDDALGCFTIHLAKLIQQIEKSQPIVFVLPAFPAKSSNIEKTQGPLPDLGEQLALRFLNELCQRVADLYEPGVRMIICSDGRVFNDLVKVSDSDVSLYTMGINNIIKDYQLNFITTLGLDHYYTSLSFAQMREQLVAEYGESLANLKKRISENEADKMLFNGIHRFIFEDELVLSTSLSRNQVRYLAKETAYQVIQRSNAWSHFVEKHFPEAMRLSIHPQLCGSKKFGIQLLKSNSVWATPWHRVVLFDGKEHQLIRKHDAELLGAKPVFSHYVM